MGYYWWKKVLWMTSILLGINISKANGNNDKDLYTLQEFKDYRGRVQVSLASDGGGIFSGALVSKSDQSSIYELQVKKNAVINGEITARKLSVSHAIHVSTMDVDSKLQAKRVKVSESLDANEVNVGNKLKVNGVVNITKALGIAGVLHVSGSITAKAGIETRNLHISGDLKTKTVENSGIIRSKVLEITESANVKGVLKGIYADFKDNITTSSMLSANFHTKHLAVSNNMDVHGKFNCDNLALFKNGLTSNGFVTINNHLNADKISSNIIETQSLILKAKTANKKHSGSALRVIDGSIEADHIISKNVIETNSFTANTGDIQDSLNVKKMITSKYVKFQSLNVTNEAHVYKLSSTSLFVGKNMEVKGEVTISGLASMDSITVGGNILAKNGIYDESLSTKNLTVGETLLVKDINIQGDLISSSDGKILVRELHVEDNAQMIFLNATRISVIEELKSDLIRGERMMASNITVSDAFIMGTLDITGKSTFHCNAR